jgi:hypothetical protein
MNTGSEIGGNAVTGVIVCSLLPEMVNSMMSAPAFALALRIAWRRDPAPESFVFVTVKVAAFRDAAAT